MCHITSSGLVFTPLRELIWEIPEYRRRPGDTWAVVARKKYRGDLTHYEKAEILSYGDHVYYVGDGEVKDVELHKNQCFADDQGFHLATRPRDHLIYRFEFNAFLAAGTFSEVTFFSVDILFHDNISAVTIFACLMLHCRSLISFQPGASMHYCYHSSGLRFLRWLGIHVVYGKRQS